MISDQRPAILELESRKELARKVFAALDGMPAAALRLLAAALALPGQDELLARFAQPIDFYADVVEYPAVSGELAALRMAYELKCVARDPRCGELIDRLEGVDAQPWQQIRAGVAVALAEREAVGWNTSEGN